MELNVLGIDLAKNVFQLHGVDKRGKAVLKKSKLRRHQVLAFVANLPRCRIGMEACGSSSYWAREFEKLGFKVQLISPQFVKPYVKSNKNDANDAEAICEAMQRESMRFVAPKTIGQQDIQAVHRVRSRLVGARTALVNEIRGLLGEYGVVLPQGINKVRKELSAVIETALEKDLITLKTQALFLDLLEELRTTDERIKSYDEKIRTIENSHPVCKRLTQIPGVGPITATAIVAAVGDPQIFKNGRQFAAWLGLVPRQHSSGGRQLLLGISKRGDTYIRSLLIHGARNIVRYTGRREKDDCNRQQKWLQDLTERRGVNRATVAVANKNARRIWVLMARNEEYREVA